MIGRAHDLDPNLPWNDGQYGVAQSFGVATDAGVSGRSHDFMLTRKQLTQEAIEVLKTFDDPFGDSENQL
jgi:hypothetical protein